MKKITRREAKTLKLKFYFTGNPCKRGHVVKRLTSNANCHLCFLEITATARSKNRPKIRERDKQYYKASPEKRIVNSKNWAKNNKKRRVEITEKYRKSHAYYYSQYSSTRRANKLKATPPWADLVEIKRIYKECPKGMHVDHIIPLKGKLVSGLHVPYNLQYLTPKENQRKNNKYENHFCI